MASINYATREISCKIVYYGPGLSGKTTNLQIIHRKIPADTKSEMVSLATETDRTLFFDFLPLDLGSIKGFATKFQLYTVPGQVYYNATRKLVLRGVDGVVFVADSQRDKMQENIDSLKNLQENLKEYGIDLGAVPFVLQYNKRDLPGVATIVEMDQHINWFKVPTFEAQAHQGVGVFTTLKAIGKIVIDTFNAKYTARQSSRRPSSLPDTASTAPHAPQASSVMGGSPAPRPTAAPSMPPPPAPRPAAQVPQPPLAPPPRPQPVAAPPAYAPPPVQPTYAPPPPPVQPAYAPPPTQQQPIYQAPPVAPPPPAPQMPVAPAAQSAPHQVYQQEGLPPQFTGFNAPPPLVPQAPHEAVPGLQAGFFTAPPPMMPNQSPGLLEPLAPPPPVNLAQVPGLQGFAPPPPPSPPSVSGSGAVASGSLPGSSTEARKKSRLDGTLEGSDLDAEIARYERELSDNKTTKPAATPAPGNGDPLAGAFLTPEELTRLQGSDSYPTRRMPLGPGGQ